MYTMVFNNILYNKNPYIYFFFCDNKQAKSTQQKMIDPSDSFWKTIQQNISTLPSQLKYSRHLMSTVLLLETVVLSS